MSTHSSGWRVGRRIAYGSLVAVIAAAAVCGPAGTALAALPAEPAVAAEPADGAAAGHQDRGRSAEAGHPALRWRFDESATTVADVAEVVGAARLWRSGLDGAGVGVALVDTGVVPVPGLLSGNVVNGPDLSVESQAERARYLDTYGHGTHLAGIIAGSDSATGFRGIAPGARLTSVKVGAFDGAVDVTQVIAAIDWVIAHRADDPAHPIRVLNLAYGTDGTQDYRIDPLTHAVENAWRAGIVVVTAAGNGGTAASTLTNPARDPYVIAVGAADTAGTVTTSDDAVCDFSSRGDHQRRVDIVAPGRSIVSLRDPGGHADATYPTARVGERLFKGSGTSQAAAVVSGAVALLLQKRPDLTPDQVKAALTGTAARLPQAAADDKGVGELDIAAASRAPRVPATQDWPRSTGTGSLEAARGSVHLAAAGVSLTGENDLFGAFDTAAWARASSAGQVWDGGRWMGRQLAGDGWSGSSWAARTWSGVTWSGQTWRGQSWSDFSWSDFSWTDFSWTDFSWSDFSWSDFSWTDFSWTDFSWTGGTWSDVGWAGLAWSGTGWR